jgi:hypothetical protein
MSVSLAVIFILNILSLRMKRATFSTESAKFARGMLVVPLTNGHHQRSATIVRGSASSVATGFGTIAEFRGLARHGEHGSALNCQATRKVSKAL